MKAPFEYFVAYADPRYNHIRIVQCLLHIKPADPRPEDRLEFKGCEKLVSGDDYCNLYLYVPAGAMEGIKKMPIVRLLEREELFEPLLIHTPVLVTAVSASLPNSILTNRVNQMRDALVQRIGLEPKITHEMIPEQYMPAHLVDSKEIDAAPEQLASEEKKRTMAP